MGAREVLSPEESAARRLVQALLISNVAEYFELSDGFSLAEVAVPPAAVGQSLYDLEIGAKFRLQRRGDQATESEKRRRGVLRSGPSSSDLLREEQILAVVGSDLDLARFMNEMGGSAPDRNPMKRSRPRLRRRREVVVGTSSQEL